MMYVLTSHKNRPSRDGEIYANGPDDMTVVAMEHPPLYEHIIVDEIPKHFKQQQHEGRFGIYMSLDEIAQIHVIKECLTSEQIDGCSTLGELKLLYELNAAKKLAAEHDLLLFDLLLGGMT